MGEGEGQTEFIGRAWLARDGKRWRPFLSVAAYQALRDDATKAIPDDLKKVAVAVECFHKASLIHDDIEDEDAELARSPATAAPPVAAAARVPRCRK